MSEPTTETKKEYTPQELKEMRDNTIEYYKQQNQLLKHRSEFEKLNADIEEARARRLMNTIRIAQMMAGPKEDPEESKEPTEEETTTEKRTLKKE